MLEDLLPWKAHSTVVVSPSISSFRWNALNCCCWVLFATVSLRKCSRSTVRLPDPRHYSSERFGVDATVTFNLEQKGNNESLINLPLSWFLSAWTRSRAYGRYFN